MGQSLLNERAKYLRKNSTDAERHIWRYLRNSQFEGIKFRRQQIIESYIVDFISFDKRIVVEIDGGQHADNLDYDIKRDACLKANGLTVLRFWNNDVLKNIEGVLESIRQHLNVADSSLPINRPNGSMGFPPPPNPLLPGEGGT